MKELIKIKCKNCKRETLQKRVDWSLRYGHKFFCLKCGRYNYTKQKLGGDVKK